MIGDGEVDASRELALFLGDAVAVRALYYLIDPELQRGEDFLARPAFGY